MQKRVSPKKRKSNLTRLTQRDDPAGLMSKEMVNQMIEKIFALRAMRDEVFRKKKEELLLVEKKFVRRIDHIEKDIYNFENAVKAISSAGEFHRMVAAYRRKKLLTKALPETKEETVEGGDSFVS